MTRKENHKETVNAEAIIAATTAAIAKDMVNIVNTAVADAIKEQAMLAQAAVAEPVPQGPAVIPPVVTPMVVHRTAEEIAAAAPVVPAAVAVPTAKPADTRIASDASIVSLVAMGVSIVGSAGYDLLFGDPNKSNLDIAIKAVSNGFIGSAAGYGMAHFLSPEDNSTLSIAAMGLTAGSLVVGVDKFVDHLFELRDAASEESVLENLIK